MTKVTFPVSEICRVFLLRLGSEGFPLPPSVQEFDPPTHAPSALALQTLFPSANESAADMVNPEPSQSEAARNLRAALEKLDAVTENSRLRLRDTEEEVMAAVRAAEATGLTITSKRSGCALIGAPADSHLHWMRTNEPTSALLVFGPSHRLGRHPDVLIRKIETIEV